MMMRKQRQLYLIGQLLVVLFSPLETILALTSYLDSAVVTFRPSLPPRFDDFSDKLLGEWRWRNNEGDDVDDDREARCGSVQEVMRSCGGAVQGIREGLGLLSCSPRRMENEKK